MKYRAHSCKIDPLSTVKQNHSSVTKFIYCIFGCWEEDNGDHAQKYIHHMFHNEMLMGVGVIGAQKKAFLFFFGLKA